MQLYKARFASIKHRILGILLVELLVTVSTSTTPIHIKNCLLAAVPVYFQAGTAADMPIARGSSSFHLIPFSCG